MNQHDGRQRVSRLWPREAAGQDNVRLRSSKAHILHRIGEGSARGLWTLDFRRRCGRYAAVPPLLQTHRFDEWRRATARNEPSNAARPATQQTMRLTTAKG